MAAALFFDRGQKKVEKGDWEATHDVSGRRLILLRRVPSARSFHCFSNKKPLSVATDPHPGEAR